MSHTLKVQDESLGGGKTGALTLSFLTEEITVEELIRERVHQEVRDHNARRASQRPFSGLVQPTDHERALNGERSALQRLIDWEPQFRVAIEAFRANQILVLVDGRQVTDLEERIQVAPRTEVTFLKLTPLVGG